MALSCRARVPGTFTATSGRARSAIVVRSHHEAVSQANAPAALLTAATLMLTAVPAMDPSGLMLQPARANEEVSEEALTPYQRRQRELERRREMLRQTREQAEAKAGTEVVAPSTVDADAAIEAANAQRSAATSMLAGELKSSAAATYESSTSSTRYRGFGGFSSAPAPAVEEPAPAPKTSVFSTRQEPKPEPVVEVKKAAPAPAPVKKVEEPKKQPAGKQKRRGPLPLFLAELIVLGSFAGLVAACITYAEQSNKALAFAAAKGKELYGMAEEAVAKAQQAK